MGRRVLRRVLRRGSKKGLSRRHLEGRSTPFREYDPVGVCPIVGPTRPYSIAGEIRVIFSRLSDRTRSRDALICIGHGEVRVYRGTGVSRGVRRTTWERSLKIWELEIPCFKAFL